MKTLLFPVRAGRAALFGFALAGLTLIVDQVTKLAALRVTADGPVEILPFFNLVMVWNRGVSFGLFNHGNPLPPVVLAAVAIAIAIGFSIWLLRARGRLLPFALGLVVGGALGNVVDRFAYGAVVDFLDFHAFGLHWPAFNIADSAIVVGIALAVFHGLFLDRPAHRNEAEASSVAKNETSAP